MLISFLINSCGEEFDAHKVKLEWLPADPILKEDSHYITVIGDIQEYTSSDSLGWYLFKTYDWLRSQQEYFNNISCVLQTGDLTGMNSYDQWERVNFSLYHLGSDILFIPCTGNHDYYWMGKDRFEIKDRSSTRLNGMRNLSSLKKRNIEYFEKGKLDNIIVPLDSPLQDLSVIALEFGPRKEVVTWADSIVRANSTRQYILMTHEWLTREGERINEGSFADLQMPNLSHSSPQEIWEKMVYPNDNILCVLCGHNGFCKYLFCENIKGRRVCQVLFNLQYQNNGGDGMVQLWEFLSDEKAINIFVYNTITRQIHPDSDTRIKIQL